MTLSLLLLNNINNNNYNNNNYNNIIIKFRVFIKFRSTSTQRC